MIIYAIVLLVLVGWLAIALGFVAAPGSRSVIRIRHGEIRVEGAELAPRAKAHVADVIRIEMVMSGFIAISPRGDVSFSRSVPNAIRQRLRNILLN